MAINFKKHLESYQKTGKIPSHLNKYIEELKEKINFKLVDYPLSKGVNPYRYLSYSVSDIEEIQAILALKDYIFNDSICYEIDKGMLTIRKRGVASITFCVPMDEEIEIRRYFRLNFYDKAKTFREIEVMFEQAEKEKLENIEKFEKDFIKNGYKPVKLSNFSDKVKEDIKFILKRYSYVAKSAYLYDEKYLYIVLA